VCRERKICSQVGQYRADSHAGLPCVTPRTHSSTLHCNVLTSDIGHRSYFQLVASTKSTRQIASTSKVCFFNYLLKILIQTDQACPLGIGLRRQPTGKVDQIFDAELCFDFIESGTVNLSFDTNP